MVNFDTARSLEEAFCFATEVNLATLSVLCMTKKTSRSKIDRQRGICLGMIRTCKRRWVAVGNVEWGTRPHLNFPRLSELMANQEPEDIMGALDRLIRTWSGPGPVAAATPLAARTG